MQFDLANALKATGRPEEAAAALHKAVALKPGYAEAHNNLGNLLRGLGRLDDAAAAYDRAVTLKPGFTEAQNNLGAVRHDQGRGLLKLVRRGTRQTRKRRWPRPGHRRRQWRRLSAPWR